MFEQVNWAAATRHTLFLPPTLQRDGARTGYRIARALRHARSRSPRIRINQHTQKAVLRPSLDGLRGVKTNLRQFLDQAAGPAVDVMVFHHLPHAAHSRPFFLWVHL